MPDGHPDQVGHPITYSGFRPHEPQPPPGLGQHDDEVRDWLTTTLPTAQESA